MLVKKNLIVLLFAGLVVLIINSCKKDDQSSIKIFLTGSPWQLASVQVFTYQGSSLIETDTLVNNCKQTFTFNTDQTCNYQNFICKTNTAKGNWQFSDDQLILQSDMICQDTVAGGRDTTDAPFRNAQIVNLGSYSLVLQTGDINTYYSSTTVRVIKRYGFIHQE